jgi:hypothetical protein
MAGDSNMDEVTAARIEGKIDLINQAMTHIAQDMADVRARMNNHGERIGAIERDRSGEAGEKRTIAAVVRVLWALIAVLLTGGVASVMSVYFAIK